MPLFYKAAQSNVPSKDGKKKWFPHLIKVGGKVETQKMAIEIARRSSLSEGDVHNVIRNLSDVMKEHLMNSRTVQLDGLGTFTARIKAGGNGVDTPEEVSPDQINYLTIQFTPAYTRPGGSKAECPMFSGIDFERMG